MHCDAIFISDALPRRVNLEMVLLSLIFEGTQSKEMVERER